MGSNFADGDIVVGVFLNPIYYLGYEKLFVVILGFWVFYVVEKIYIVEAIYEYKCIDWERFGVFHGDQECV